MYVVPTNALWLSSGWSVTIYTHDVTIATNKVITLTELNCHFLAPDWNCMTHRQALQAFPDMSQL
jgi:hypothetical protein